MATVFISHRKADDQEAERLANQIRNSGHQVWLDEWNIGLGDSIVEKMDEGLEGATYVVVCPLRGWGVNGIRHCPGS